MKLAVFSYAIIITLFTITSCECPEESIYTNYFHIEDKYMNNTPYTGKETIVFVSDDGNHDTLKFKTQNDSITTTIVNVTMEDAQECHDNLVYCENKYYSFYCIQDPLKHFDFGIQTSFSHPNYYSNTYLGEILYLKIFNNFNYKSGNINCRNNNFFPPMGTTKTFNNGKEFNNTFQLFVNNGEIGSGYYFNTELGIINLNFNNVNYCFERFE